MATKNLTLSRLTETYPDIVTTQIDRKINHYLAIHPQQKIYRMAMGNTTQPISPIVIQTLMNAVNRLGDRETYTGYEPIVGNPNLKQAIAHNYYQQSLKVELDREEVFISDGAQSVAVNIQELFALNNKVAIPNPAYPAFIEGTWLSGRPSIKLPCCQENNFVPQPPEEHTDLIYLCFPNNPTGVVATREQLKAFVDYARNHQAVIIFDAAYSFFITTPTIPRSIYEIEGAKECAIEINSFSKWASFTGLRVGWCVIPQALRIKDTDLGELNELWRTRHNVKDWGPSTLAQQGAISALSAVGQQECRQTVEYYLENARLLRQGLAKTGLQYFGGVDSPFIWVKTAPNLHLSSWQFFEKLLHSTGIVGVPGCLFGDRGEGYLRLSVLGQREEIREATGNLEHLQLQSELN